ncbi:bifunctional aspartate kinase/homoserine dehydrogenase I [bacterium]|nr:MAG: bifunctional aspartate kinase/homoserine dehydrogenase I [bacterium]
MKVLKFGGTSVKDARNISKVIDIVSANETRQIVVVVSALGGITNQLIEAANQAEQGKETYKALLAEIEVRHLDVVKALITVNRQSSVVAKVKMQLNELEDLLRGLSLVGEVSPRTLDVVQSFGERLSSYIIFEAFKEKGIEVTHLDARLVIKTDSNYNKAIVDFEKTDALINDWFNTHRGIHVVPGFISSSHDGKTTTLGRGGSDYTAAIFAAALDSEILEIWTDVDGMMTADPRKVSKALPVEEVTYSEAMELSHFGAKVIYPPTILPAMNKKIPILIKNTFNPEAQGTLISDSIEDHHNLIRGISSIDDVCLLTVQGSGLIGVSGIAMRIFRALANEKVNVILITQGSSEHAVTFAVLPKEADKARIALETEFALERKLNMIDSIQVDKELSVIAVVGENMKNTPGISARLFEALARNGISVICTAQGASELNISVVINRFNERKALNAIHESFFLSNKKRLNVFLVGTGTIGRTLISQINEQLEFLTSHANIDVRLVGLSNSKKMWFNEEGISLTDWKEELDLHGSKSNIHEFIHKMKELNMRNSVFVDNTASADVSKCYADVLDANINLVTANKIANSGSLKQYKKLQELALRRNVYFLYETNVGAGLPIISTLKDLIHSGDKIIKIEAILSGTLNYLFSTMSESKSFSSTVKEAKELGYTEPDPRLDLNGKDVGRKVLILSREIGLQLEPEDVQVENLMTAETDSSETMDEFWANLPKHEDARYAEKIKKALADGKRLRYVATIEDGKVTTGVKEFDASHPFYSLEGSDNMIKFTTVRYLKNPLMVKGPGAGAEVTAAGVFADLIRIINTP